MKVLIVDDAIFMRMKLKQILKPFQYEIQEAENGKIACEIFEKDPADVILMDISMPVMNGIDALRRIHEMNPEVPVIIVSAIGQETQIVKALSLGAKDFIVKPFKSEKIIDAIKTYGKA